MAYKNQEDKRRYAREWARDLKIKNPDKYRENQVRALARSKKDPHRTWIRHFKNKVRARGIEYNLTAEDFKVPEKCPILGISLAFTTKRSDCTPSMDRIDNTKGYVKGNVIIVSWRANRLKSDASIEELKKLTKFYSKFA